MKKLQKLKLHQLSNVDLNEREMNLLLGSGGNCGCACRYQGQPGGSTTSANYSANEAIGITSPGYTMNDIGPKCGFTKINTNTDTVDCSQPVNCNSEPNKC